MTAPVPPSTLPAAALAAAPPCWTEPELAAALAGAMQSDWAQALRREALAQLGHALDRHGFACGEALHLAVAGQADEEWLAVTARTVAAIADPLGGEGGRHLQAEAVLACLGHFDTFPQPDHERRAQPVSLTVRLELRVGAAASLGEPLEADSFRSGTVECSLGQAGRDAPIASADALVAWFREAAMANATPARERTRRMATMASELQFQLAP